MVKRENEKIYLVAFIILFLTLIWIVWYEANEPRPSYNMSTFLNCESDYTNSIGMKFAKVPAGSFMMGSPSTEYGRDDDEEPVHMVTIKEPYYLGKFEVTQEQWRKVMGSNSTPSHPKSIIFPVNTKGDYYPVNSVSWYDAQEFIRKLNQMEGTDKYRLPSEAEWEYACRAGTTTPYCCGDDLYTENDSSGDDNDSIITDYGCYVSEDGLIPVGQMQPNDWGLYDMHGNVYEWCQDKYHNNYDGAPSDGSTWEKGVSSKRVYRGGCYDDRAFSCRSANREDSDADSSSNALGFRILRTL
jgi:formylglycine-generating enzyme required for sulfatase activity